MLSNITVPLLGLVDTAVLGHLDNASYLAGVALSTTLFTSVFWLFGFLRMGTCGMTAQAVGQQDTARILKLLLSSFWFAIIMGMALILCQSLWIPTGLELLSGQPTSNEALAHDQLHVVDQATLYTDWRILGAPFVLLNYSIIGWFVGRQNTKVPLVMLIFANLINILLDLVLVIYFDMGVEGVAIATLCADLSSTALGLWFIHKHYHSEFHFINKPLPEWQIIKEMIQVNRFIFVRTGTLLLTFAIFTSQGARIGDDFLAANAVLLTFLLLISSALDGFAHGAEALVGEACGQKDHSQVKRVIRISLLWSAVSAVVLFVGFAVGGTWLISVLTDLEAIRNLAADYLIWLVVMPLIGTWCYTYDGVFIGATKVRAMQNVMLISTLVIFLPIVYFAAELTHTSTTHNHVLWLAMACFMFSRSVGMGVMSHVYSKNKQWFAL